MIAKKDLIDKATADGAIDRMNQLLSAAHILNCEANALVEEAADLMDKYGLLLWGAAVLLMPQYGQIENL